MKKITTTQIITLLLLVAWGVWEYKMNIWEKTQIGASIRIDLLIILPVMAVLIGKSIYQFKNKKNK